MISISELIFGCIKQRTFVMKVPRFIPFTNSFTIVTSVWLLLPFQYGNNELHSTYRREAQHLLLDVWTLGMI